MFLLDLNNAAFSYDQLPIFQGIKFSVSKGEIFCLLGPNGCGKTTLLDCILGIHRLDQGTICFNGQDTKKFKPVQMARHVSYVPQKHEETFPYTVIDMVKMGRAAYTGIFSSPSQQDKQIAKEALQKVGLFHLRHRPFTQLSGGEAQLVMIARALAQRTPLIIMDEPTAHLDFKHELIVMETIVDLVKHSGVTVIMATHFPNHSFYFENSGVKTTVALFHKGGFLASGSPSEVLSESNMKDLYNVNTKLVSYQIDGETELKQIIPINTVA